MVVLTTVVPQKELLIETISDRLEFVKTEATTIALSWKDVTFMLAVLLETETSYAWF